MSQENLEKLFQLQGGAKKAPRKVLKKALKKPPRKALKRVPRNP